MGRSFVLEMETGVMAKLLAAIKLEMVCQKSIPKNSCINLHLTTGLRVDRKILSVASVV